MPKTNESMNPEEKKPAATLSRVISGVAINQAQLAQELIKQAGGFVGKLRSAIEASKLESGAGKLLESTSGSPKEEAATNKLNAPK
ncbi:MAG: hypothetical protein NTZ67_00080 [Gammaproteobacteria bacterium]|nr:hypothetical protein [Gammaproteobacteria bacterium]